MHIYTQLLWDLSHPAPLSSHFSWLKSGNSRSLNRPRQTQRNCQTSPPPGCRVPISLSPPDCSHPPGRKAVTACFSLVHAALGHLFMRAVLATHLSSLVKCLSVSFSFKKIIFNYVVAGVGWGRVGRGLGGGWWRMEDRVGGE